MLKQVIATVSVTPDKAPSSTALTLSPDSETNQAAVTPVAISGMKLTKPDATPRS
jgi:hypothetical protein